MIDKVRGKWGLALAGLVVATSGCTGDETVDGELITQMAIGPSGGELVGGGITLTIPAGAVMNETDFELRSSTTSLSAADFSQASDTVEILPEDVEFRRAVALTSDRLSDDAPALLFEQDGLTVAATGTTAYINQTGLVAAARAGEAVTTLVDPVALGTSPSNAGATVLDRLHLKVATTDTPRLNIVLTAYDEQQVYGRPLNGTSEGACGLQLEEVRGGSLAGGCQSGPTTAQVTVNSAEVEFDVVTHLAGELDTPVPVGVIIGGDDLAYHMGFFSFATTPGG